MFRFKIQAIQHRHFTGNTFDAQAVGPVRRQINLDHIIVQRQIISNIGSHRRVGRQFHQAFGIFCQTQLFFGTQHTERFDAAQFRLIDFEIAGQYRTDQCCRNFQTDPNICSSANDLQRFGLTNLDLADSQSIGIGMRLHRQNFANHDSAKIGRRRRHRIDLETGHCQLPDQFRRRNRRIDQLP